MKIKYMYKFKVSDRVKELNGSVKMNIDEIQYVPSKKGFSRPVRTGFVVCGWMTKYGYFRQTYRTDELMLLNKDLDIDDLRRIYEERNLIFAILL